MISFVIFEKIFAVLAFALDYLAGPLRRQALVVQREQPMATRQATMTFGWRVYGLGVMALGLACLASRQFVLGQAAPEDVPLGSALAYVAAAVMLVAGGAVGWHRTTAFGAAAVIVFYALIVTLIDGPAVVAGYTEYGTYSGIAEQVAIIAGALVVFAASAGIDAALAARLTRLGQGMFGVCALLFGGAHFVYMNLTVPLVPKWLPPTQQFWAYATGFGHIAAGIAIVTGVRSRLAATLLTTMYASFTPLVHVPMLFADPANHANWTENAINIALTGAAWVMADSLAQGNRQAPVRAIESRS